MIKADSLNTNATPSTQSGGDDGSSHNANSNAEVRIVVDRYTTTAIGLDNLSVKDRCHHLMTLHLFAQGELSLLISLLTDNHQPSPVLQSVVSKVPSHGISEFREMVAEPTHELGTVEGVV